MSSPSIRTIASELLSAKTASNIGATVVLGAGASIRSGVPSWPDLAARICEDLSIVHHGNPVEAIVEYFSLDSARHNNRYHLLEPYLLNKRPSKGYMHLAELANQGLVRVVLTTNWDSLLENAFHRLMPAERIKTLVRGEVPDDLIAGILESTTRGPVIVKLHGDVAARSFLMTPAETGEFEPRLLDALHRVLNNFTIMVGQSAQDVDLLGTLLTRPGGAQRRAGRLYHVRYDDNTEIDKILDKAGARAVAGQHEHVLSPAAKVNIGDFDRFFSQLSVAVQLRQLSGRQGKLRRVQKEILAKEKRGLGYINYTAITELVEKFTRQVFETEPDLVYFINDPSAPGGLELKRRMQSDLESKGIAMGEILVEGEKSSRTFNRIVRSDTPGASLKVPKSITILDSITFSGNTIGLARKKVEEWYPNAMVRTGVLVISQQLVEQETDLEDYNQTMYQTVTDRYEIFFPWGVTGTTSAFDRRFMGVDDKGRTVQIVKRPWGAIEILANEETTSVRLLTIEAHRQLSFQRHLCRDELFVALDDDIGLDICADELSRDADQYDPRIASLILEKGDYILIPRGIWHRTKASMDRVRLLEVAFGVYDQEDDIERRWDDWDRVNMDGAK